jgi:hypothetical protein
MNSNNLEFYIPYAFNFKYVDSFGSLNNTINLLQNISESDSSDFFDNTDLASINSKLYNEFGINFGEENSEHIKPPKQFNIIYYDDYGNLIKNTNFDTNIYLYKLKSESIVIGSMMNL